MVFISGIPVAGRIALATGAGAVAACLLLLFLLVFPLINKYRGTDFPCRDFRSTVEARRRKKTKAADVSWVPTVPLPEMTGKRPELKASSIRTAYFKPTDKK